MFLTLFYDYRHLEKLGYPLYFLSLLLLVGVMVAGKMVYGCRRWLLLGPFSFQPAEVAKIGGDPGAGHLLQPPARGWKPWA